MHEDQRYVYTKLAVNALDRFLFISFSSRKYKGLSIAAHNSIPKTRYQGSLVIQMMINYQHTCRWKTIHQWLGISFSLVFKNYILTRIEAVLTVLVCGAKVCLPSTTVVILVSADALRSSAEDEEPMEFWEEGREVSCSATLTTSITFRRKSWM